MPEDQPEEFLPELTSIKFPSDSVTLGQMRREQPELLFSDRALVNPHRQLTDLDAIETIHVEHILARKAWAKAIGLPDPHPTRDRREEVKYLNDDYQRYGLSTGKKQTEELIRSFEREAVRLAKLSVGEGRG